MTDIFAQDIALDHDAQARVAANGELVLTSGPATGVQDIRLRITTYIGSLFYDQAYGCNLPDWVMDENDAEGRFALIAEVKRCIGDDPRVVVGSVSAQIAKWDEVCVTVFASFTFVDQDHAHNLIIELGKSKKDMVVKDANPAVI